MRAILAGLALLAGATASVVPASCGQSGSCTAQIQAALTACFNSASDCVVELEAGAEYPLTGSDNMACLLSAVLSDSSPARPTSFTLDGHGAGVIIQPLAGFLCISGIGGVTVRNLTVDMARQPYSLGRAVASSGSSSVFHVDTSAYPQKTPTGDWTSQVQAILQYDPANDRPAAKGTDIYRLAPALSAAWAPGPNASSAAVTVSIGGIPPGTWQILRHQVYGLSGITMGGVQDATIEDVWLYSVPGMGFVSDAATGITMRRSGVRKRPGRPMSITADGAHFTSCRGGDVRIEACLFEGQGDDGGNIPSRYWEIRQMSADRRTLQVWQRGAEVPFHGLPGDPLLFYNRTTFAAYGRGGAIKIASINGTAGTLTLTAPLPAVGGIWDLVLNLANQPRSITVIDSTYRVNRARGLILKASDVAVINCTFDHNTGPAVRVVPDGAMWFEGDVVSRGNWTFRNNRVIGVNYATAANPGDVTFGADGPIWQNGVPTTRGQQVPSGTQHYNVTVSDNVFIQNDGQAALAADGVDGVVATGNSITSTAGRPPTNFALAPTCSRVHVSGNTCSPGPCKTT